MVALTVDVFIDREAVDVNKKARKNEANIFDRTSLVNKEFITWPKRELLLAVPINCCVWSLSSPFTYKISK